MEGLPAVQGDLQVGAGSAFRGVLQVQHGVLGVHDVERGYDSVRPVPAVGVVDARVHCGPGSVGT
ncbi:hypothetical protein [Streptomyces flavofungini]|uniref:hypothetical protein n=1 Tax=Streptomyces flavofungini TaxID=68200 RepID=UPI0034DFFE87